MSIKIMSAVFENETLGPTERLIMLALADHADDAGRCYPSISRLCQRTGLGERAIQNNLKALVAKGYVTIVPNAGQGLANLYFVTATPAPDAPPHEMHPRTKFASTPASRSKTPAPDAPKPSRTITEPSDGDTERDRAKVRMTADWHPGETGIAYALKQNIPMEIIEDEVAGFRVYWMDRTDKLGRKSPEGWLQCWQNRCRDLAPRYAGRRSASGGPFAGRGQQPSGLVGAAMRSHAARGH